MVSIVWNSGAGSAFLEPRFEAGFAHVEVQTVVQQIAFPSVLDYVRFQLLATPMAALLRDRDEADRQATIKTIA